MMPRHVRRRCVGIRERRRSAAGWAVARGVPARALAEAAAAGAAGDPGLSRHRRRRDAFLALATRDDARSRLVIHHPRRAPARRWERHDGPFGALDGGHAAGARLDAAGQQRREPDPGRLGDPAAVLVPAGGADRRPHDQLRGGRRVGGAARRSLRRVPAAGAGAAALAGEPAARPRARSATRRSRCCGRSCRRRSGCSSRATCCTCRRAWRTTASPRGRASPTRSASSPRRTPICTAASSATSARCWGRTSIRGAIYQDPGSEVGGGRRRTRSGTRWSRGWRRSWAARAGAPPTSAISWAACSRTRSRRCGSRRRRGRSIARRSPVGSRGRGGPARRLALALPSRGLVRRGRLFLNGEAYTPAARGAAVAADVARRARAAVAAAARARRRRDAGDCCTPGTPPATCASPDRRVPRQSSRRGRDRPQPSALAPRSGERVRVIGVDSARLIRSAGTRGFGIAARAFRRPRPRAAAFAASGANQRAHVLRRARCRACSCRAPCAGPAPKRSWSQPVGSSNGEVVARERRPVGRPARSADAVDARARGRSGCARWRRSGARTPTGCSPRRTAGARARARRRSPARSRSGSRTSGRRAP